MNLRIKIQESLPDKPPKPRGGKSLPSKLPVRLSEITSHAASEFFTSNNITEWKNATEANDRNI